MRLRKNLLSYGTINKVVKSDRLEIMQKELNAVGGTKILFFDVKSIEELFSSFALIIGFTLFVIFMAILNKSSLKSVIILLIGIVIVCYAQYRKPIDKYKDSFMKDIELPSAIDTIISGLDSGLPLMYIFNYIKKNKSGNTSNLISECVANVDAGEDFHKALKDISEKSFNSYFIRMALIIKKSDTSTLGLSEQLLELQKDIEEERLNKKNEKVNKLDNALFFPILLGYFIPLVLMIVLPFLAQAKSLQL